MIDVIAVMAAILVLVLTVLPGIAKSNPNSKAFQCLENHRRLVNANRMFAADNGDVFVSAESVPGRSTWITGNMDSSSANVSNYDINQDIVKSPLWPYLDKTASSFKCPTDPTTLVLVNGRTVPRVRSYSMSQVFGQGLWLDGAFINPSISRIYAKGSDIVVPSKTFLFTDEHPRSINDGAFANTVVGAQPGDPPSNARIIDFPAAWHEGGCTFSFADGHADIHKWIGSTIKPSLSTLGTLTLNVSAGDSAVDIQWLAANTTVRK